MRPALRAAVLLALAGHLCAPPAARAQRGGTEPLRKVELVRLLGSRAISTTQVVVLVRRNCVAFRPSERDRADLRAAGADDAVLTAIDQCLRARAPVSRPAPQPSAPVSRPSAPAPPRVAQQPAPVAAPVPQAPQPAPAPPPPPPPPRPVPAEDLTQFTLGAGQHGAAGSALAIVLEVRDPTGAPIAKQPAAFVVSAGAVTPAAAEADAAGTVRVRVTLPERAGPVVITAKVGTFSRTATVYADPGPAHELVVERGRAPVVGSVAVRSRDTLVLRVVARDAYGNRTTLADFTATTSGRAIGLVAAAAADSQALVTLEPRKSGVSEVQVSASGLRARVTVDVALPAAARPWAIGARSAWLGSNDPWIASPSLTGISGGDFALFGRRSFPGADGLSLALGAEAGSLSADRTGGPGGPVSMLLLEAFGRAELAVLPRGPVSPVVSLGVGGYRLKSDDNGQTVYHTNAFWSGGVGLDVTVSPRVTLEARVERQWMRDTNLGHVATFWPVGVGARLAL